MGIDRKFLGPLISFYEIKKLDNIFFGHKDKKYLWSIINTV
jgi:hypothetical protein